MCYTVKDGFLDSLYMVRFEVNFWVSFTQLALDRMINLVARSWASICRNGISLIQFRSDVLKLIESWSCIVVLTNFRNRKDTVVPIKTPATQTVRWTSWLWRQLRDLLCLVLCVRTPTTVVDVCIRSRRVLAWQKSRNIKTKFVKTDSLFSNPDQLRQKNDLKTKRKEE